METLKQEAMNAISKMPEIGDTNVRELIIYSYRLIYEVVPNDVQILAIIHEKRDFSSLDRIDFKR